MPHARSIVWLLALAASVPSPADAACKPARYQIMGQVLDAQARPLVDVRVRLLLDEVSAAKFEQEGPRARSTRTNAAGSYVTMIDCDAAAGVTDAPNPCARKPRHLTVMVEAPDHRTKLVVFKLKDLDVEKDAGGCLVLAPDVKLSR